MEKIFLTAGQLLADSFRLAAKIHASGFRPELIAGVWRGGTPVAIAVQEYFEYRGTGTEHFPVKCASYSGIDQRSTTVDVSLPPELLERLPRARTLLIVDDVFDTGHSMHTLVSRLRAGAGESFRGDVRVACPWYKPARNQTDLVPHYFLHETACWIVFPHELAGLGMDEIRAGKADLAAILDQLDLD